MPPILRQYNRAAPAALNTFALATDAFSGLTFTNVPRPNTILDAVNQPDPAAGLLYEIRLQKNFQDMATPLFSSGLSAASAGRVAIGPINISPANWSYNVQQTLGALTAYSFAVKYAGPVT